MNEFKSSSIPFETSRIYKCKYLGAKKLISSIENSSSSSH